MKQVILRVPENFQKIYGFKTKPFSFIVNHEFSIDPQSSWNESPEYVDLNRTSLPLSPIFGCQMKEFRPPLPKYLSWQQITQFYNK